MQHLLLLCAPLALVTEIVSILYWQSLFLTARSLYGISEKLSCHVPHIHVINYYVMKNRAGSFPWSTWYEDARCEEAKSRYDFKKVFEKWKSIEIVFSEA